MATYEKREWEILDGIAAGKTQKELGITNEYEKDFYERHKEVYDRLTKQGVKVAWSPVFD